MEWCVYSVFCLFHTNECTNIFCRQTGKKRPTMKLSYDNCYRFFLLVQWKYLFSLSLSLSLIFVDCNSFCVFAYGNEGIHHEAKVYFKFHTIVFVCDGRFQVLFKMKGKNFIQFPWIESIVTKCSIGIKTKQKEKLKLK